MIPTMILIGLVIGLLPKPWYLVGLATAVVFWPVLLLATGTIETGETAEIVGAAALALQNTVIGLVITKGVFALMSNMRTRSER
jgi:hypothetical protein